MADGGAKQPRNAFAVLTAGRKRKLSSTKALEEAGESADRSRHTHTLQGSTGSDAQRSNILGGGASPAPATKPNAFAVLAANAAAKFEAHHFFAGIVGGNWCAAIWQVGTPAPGHVPKPPWAWTASVKVALPQHDDSTGTKSKAAKRSVEIQLCSNVPSDSATVTAHTDAGKSLQHALQQARAPSDPAYSGGVPLLKSALQVRKAFGW